MRLPGLHHITAIASNAKRNVDFYTRVLGLRLVKKTVNFDDPGTYHLYYGDHAASPGTLLTFFLWDELPRGRPGDPALSSRLAPLESQLRRLRYRLYLRYWCRLAHHHVPVHRRCYAASHRE